MTNHSQFHIIQSNSTNRLLERLIDDYTQTHHASHSQHQVFDTFTLIVPSSVLGDWVKQSIASKVGISTLIDTKFWGQMQWQLMQTVLDAYQKHLARSGLVDASLKVPEVAVLSTTVMQWRLFGYLSHYHPQILANHQHPLYPILSRLLADNKNENNSNSDNSNQLNIAQAGIQQAQQANTDNKANKKTDNNVIAINVDNQHQHLWQLSNELAKVFTRYLNHRQNWLDLWTNNQAVDVKQLIADKDKLTQQFNASAIQQFTPEWLHAHYHELERAQGYLWRLLFAGVYQHRQRIEQGFWQIMQRLYEPSHQQSYGFHSSNSHGSNHPTHLASNHLANLQFTQDEKAQLLAQLPKRLILFTLQQLPNSELHFLQRLAKYLDITLYHYNPSQEFWADIVDKRWLQRQQILNAQQVYLKDYGHTLLSRLGKQTREIFAALVEMSGNEFSDDLHIIWDDDFVVNEALLFNDSDSNSFDYSSNFSHFNISEHFSNATQQFDGITEETAQFDLFGSVPEPALNSKPEPTFKPATMNLLQQLQHDILMLDESSTQQVVKQQITQSLLTQVDELSQLNDVEANQGNQDSSNQDKPTQSQINQANQPQINQSQPNQQDWLDEQQLQQLKHKKTNQPPRCWQLNPNDNSLSIHACHSLQRQLEVLRGMIGRWLNAASAQQPRHIADILVLLPNVEGHADLIQSVFVDGQGADGLTLPAKVTGVVDNSIRELWQSMCGYYQLLGRRYARFNADALFDWLLLPAMYESLGLSVEQMNRGCELLVAAGFVRGFDESHLAIGLDDTDKDYRFSFAYALDRLVLGLMMPQAGISACLYPHTQKLQNSSDANTLNIKAGQTQIKQEQVKQTLSMAEYTLPLPQITLSDAPIIDALTKVYQRLHHLRHAYQQQRTAEQWIKHIESQVIHPFFSNFDQTRAMGAIYTSMNGFKRSLRANRHYPQYQQNHQSSQNLNNSHAQTSFQQFSQSNLQQPNVERLPFHLDFLLTSIEADLENQQISAEPTGVITFARFGALRSLPYQLIVMLNMNLSHFPRRERDDRYDLMKAGIAKRGDRAVEDDDNGAFLDALLCAQNACWIFYNGHSLTDDNDYLPANPVSELLQFLQGEVDWQLTDDHIASDISNNHTAINFAPLIEDWLVTHYASLPFADEVFTMPANLLNTSSADSEQAHPDATVNQAADKTDKTVTAKTDIEAETAKTTPYDKQMQQQLYQLMQQQKYHDNHLVPPAPIWSQVYKQLQDEHKQQITCIELPNQSHYQAIEQLLTFTSTLSNHQFSHQLNNEEIHQFNELHAVLLSSLPHAVNLTQLSRQLSLPAHTFLREQQINIDDIDDELNQLEPLALGGLQTYQVNQNLLEGLLTTNKPLQGINTNTQTFFETPVGQLLFTPILPAGIARQTSLQQQSKFIQQHIMALYERLQSAEVTANIPHLQQLAKRLSNIDNTQADKHLSANAATELKTELNTQDTTKTLNSTNNELNLNLAQLITATAEQSINIPLQLPVTNVQTDTETDTQTQSQTKTQTENQPAIQQIATQTDGQFTITQVEITATLPTATELAKPVWINVLPNTASSKHLLTFWLAHLCWQVARNTSSVQADEHDGISIWHFNRASKETKKLQTSSTMMLPAISKTQACAELSKWLIFANMLSKHPLCLLPKHAMMYVEKCTQADMQQMAYQPSPSDYASWLSKPYGYQHIPEDCCLHPTWQYIFSHHTEKHTGSYAALVNALTYLADALYLPLYQQMTPVV